MIKKFTILFLILASIQVFSKHILYRSEVLVVEKKLFTEEPSKADQINPQKSNDLETIRKETMELIASSGNKGITYQQPNGKTFTNGLASFTLQAVDDISGKDSIEYSLNDSPFITYSYPILINKSGMNTLKYRAIDKVGNKENPKVIEYYVDKTPPNLNVNVFGDSFKKANQTYYAPNIKFTPEATDSESGVKGIYMDVNTKGFLPLEIAESNFTAQKDYQVNIVILDNVLNKKSLSYVFKVDATKPTVSLKASPLLITPEISLCSAKTIIKIIGADSESGLKSILYRIKGNDSWANYSEELTIPDSITDFQMDYKAVDKVGNESDPITFSCKVDRKPPETNKQMNF